MQPRLSSFSVVSASMPFQMALDQLLFERAVEAHQQKNAQPPEALLRFYYSSEPWISIGYSHAGWKTLNHQGVPEAFLEESKRVPLCRRMTGGGRVLHGRDLMFTLIAPKDMHPRYKSVMDSYTQIHEVLQLALKAVGINAGFYQDDKPLPAGKDCFLFPITSDLAVSGKKIAGGGQKRSLGVLLHQESIQLENTSLYEPLMTEFSARLSASLGCVGQTADWQPELFDAAENLGREKYEILSSYTTAEVV